MSKEPDATEKINVHENRKKINKQKRQQLLVMLYENRYILT
jgi:hypothetical protein